MKAINVISAAENCINITMTITASMLLSKIVLVDVYQRIDKRGGLVYSGLKVSWTHLKSERDVRLSYEMMGVLTN